MFTSVLFQFYFNCADNFVHLERFSLWHRLQKWNAANILHGIYDEKSESKIIFGIRHTNVAPASTITYTPRSKLIAIPLQPELDMDLVHPWIELKA